MHKTTPGRVSGKLTDKKRARLLIGVTVLVQNTSKGAVTDVEGRYIATAASPVPIPLDFKYMGYQTKSISEVAVKNRPGDNPGYCAGRTQIERPAGSGDPAAPINRKPSTRCTLRRRITPAFPAVFPAESISRSPDRNTSEVLKRVSGASIQDNKYIIVRGLSDRYNTATITNAILPSTEPDRKTFSFDIIPSNLIDNIVINKTASPEMPGEFAGGPVQVLHERHSY